MKRKIIFIAAIISLLGLMWNLVNNILTLRAIGQAVAITIIGGADEPTAIYVGKSVLEFLITLLPQGFVTVVLFLCWRWSGKEK